MNCFEKHLRETETSINFEITPVKVEAAVKKILADCRSQNFTVREFAHLVGDLNAELEFSRNKAEKQSAF